MIRHIDKEKVREFYDFVSPFFHALWGEHLHHGYWIRGDETREIAQAQLVEHLATIANIGPGLEILDIGCGMGASSIYLAKHYNAVATGITISPIQLDMARKAAITEGVNARFLLMDAEAMKFEKLFDVVWSVESVSHYQDISKFFGDVANLLQPNGTFALIDWFKRENLDPADYKKHILPIEKGMLVELGTMQEYQSMMKACGLEIIRSEVMNQNCAKTWDLGSDIIKKKALWKFAAKRGSIFLDFLRAFRALRSGFTTGDFAYGLIIAQKAPKVWKK
jgi:tocopherol O-methyltransferase